MGTGNITIDLVGTPTCAWEGCSNKCCSRGIRASGTKRYNRYCSTHKHNGRKRDLTWPVPTEDRVRELCSLTNEQYWETPEWYAMRRYIMARDERRCRICNSDNRISVHHRTYHRGRGKELPNDLITVCLECHELFHNLGKIKNHSRYVEKKRERRRRQDLKQFPYSRKARLQRLKKLEDDYDGYNYEV